MMTDETLRKLREAFLMGCSDVEACLYADIGTTAFYDYQKEHPEFTEEKEQLKENPVIEARQSILKHMGKDGNLALKFLERRKKDEFSLKQVFEGSIGHKISLSALFDEAEEQKKQLEP